MAADREGHLIQNSPITHVKISYLFHGQKIQLIQNFKQWGYFSHNALVILTRILLEIENYHQKAAKIWESFIQNLRVRN